MRPEGVSWREPPAGGAKRPAHGFAKANAHEARRCLKERAARRGSEAPGNRVFAKANAYEARRCLKERAHPPGERSTRHTGSLRRTSMRPEGASRREPTRRGREAPGNRVFAKANAHEARRCLMERATRRESEAPGNTRLAARPCGVHAGNSRKMAATTHINPRP